MAGILLCVSSVVSVVLSVVIRRGGPISEQGSAWGGAFFALLLGLALIQGVNGVRVLILVLSALASVAMIVAASLLHSVREIQAMALATLLICVGYFALLLKKEAPKAWVAVAASLVVAGMAASVAAQLLLAGLGKRAFGDEIRKAASDQREYSDPEAGLSIKLPAGWVMLRPDAELYRGVPARVTLAAPEAGAVAFINQEDRPVGLLSLDHYLDSVLANLKEAGLEPQQSGRHDTVVGRATARRMALTWVEDGHELSGFISAWIDGKRIFTLMGSTLGEWTDDTDSQFTVLEGALRFTAPVETALTDAEQRVTSVCPVFTAESVRMVARRISAGSAAEDYFRVGWSWAIKGQTQLDAASITELRELMGTLFAGMSPAQRQTFGAYSEKVREGRRTSRDEDSRSMRILGQAARTIPPDSLTRLQALTDAALTVGALM